MGILVGGFLPTVQLAQLVTIDDVEHAHGGVSATIGIRFNRDGTVDVDSGAGWSYIGDYVSDPHSTVGDDFEVLMDDTTGAWDSGTVDSYQDLTTTRTWTETSSANEFVTFTVTVREIANHGNNDSQAGITFRLTF